MGILQDSDVECLHNFRIAVRQARTLLAQAPDVIPQRTLNFFKTGLANIGAETTPLRDLDVILLNFDKYRSLLPPQQKGDLDTAYEAVKTRRAEAHERTCRLLRSESYQQLKTRLSDYLSTPLPAKTTLSNAKRPVLETANKRIWKCYKRVLKQGKAITGASPADDLHTLRKSCKKLRYLIKFFVSLYPTSKIKPLVESLKQLQDMLGEYQDLYIHQNFFADLRRQLNEQSPLSSATDQALACLIAAFKTRRTQTRARFREVFHTFSRKPHQKNFNKLFEP
jgi:CHAD domain-containing protein